MHTTSSAADQSAGQNKAFAAKKHPIVGKKQKLAAAAKYNNIAATASVVTTTPVTTAATTPTSTVDQSTGKTKASSAAKTRPVLGWHSLDLRSNYQMLKSSKTGFTRVFLFLPLLLW